MANTGLKVELGRGRIGRVQDLSFQLLSVIQIAATGKTSSREFLCLLHDSGSASVFVPE